MLDTLSPIALQLEASGRLFTDAIRDFPADAWESRLGGDTTNHAAFLALHLLDARCYILRSLGVDARHDFQDRTEGARELEDIPEYPGVEEILSAWETVSAKTGPALEEVTPETLASEAPFAFPIEDDTVLGMLAFLTQHEAYHVGQLGMIRRAHGLAPLFGRPPG